MQLVIFIFLFFKQKTAYEMRISDWSSDVSLPILPGAGRISRVHGPFVSDEEVERVVAELKAQAEPVYVEAVTADAEGKYGAPGTRSEERRVGKECVST